MPEITEVSSEGTTLDHKGVAFRPISNPLSQIGIYAGMLEPITITTPDVADIPEQALEIEIEAGLSCKIVDIGGRIHFLRRRLLEDPVVVSQVTLPPGDFVILGLAADGSEMGVAG